MENEIWRDIKGYKGLYQVSNLGNIKSLNYKRSGNAGILAGGKNTQGYYHVVLRKNGLSKIMPIHKLVAIAFLNHTPCGYKIVVNHKNFIITDNRACNLELISQRENTNQKHIKSTSKYVGVSWFKRDKKWSANINIKGKIVNLGYYYDEKEASIAYQKALKELLNKTD